MFHFHSWSRWKDISSEEKTISKYSCYDSEVTTIKTVTVQERHCLVCNYLERRKVEAN